MGTNRLSLPQQLVKAKDLAEEQGWQVVATRGNHVRWIPPDVDGVKGQVVITGSTPSPSGIARDMKLLRRSGLITDPGAVRAWRKEQQEAAAAAAAHLFAEVAELELINGDKLTHVCVCGARFQDPNAWEMHPRFCPGAPDDLDSEHVGTNGASPDESPSLLLGFEEGKVDFAAMTRMERHWWEVRAGLRAAPRMASRLKAEGKRFVITRDNFDAAVARGWTPPEDEATYVLESAENPASVRLNPHDASPTSTPAAVKAPSRATRPKVEPVAPTKEAQSECPHCHRPITKSNLARHIERYHPDAVGRTPDNLLKSLMEVVFPDGMPMDSDKLMLLADWIPHTKVFLSELARLDGES